MASAAASLEATSKCPARRRKRLAFRLAAVGLGCVGFLLILGLLEFCCWLAGWGDPLAYDDPFVGFSTIHPLFVLDEKSGQWVIAPSRLRFFAPDSFAARKPSTGRRAFCLGGSTVQGRPFSTPTSFPTFLRLGLNMLDPQHPWEVVNCGGISYASYRLIPILRECLSHQPDLILLCTGHNEFLEDRTYTAVKQLPAAVAVGRDWLGGLRTFTLLRSAAARVTGRSALPAHRPMLPPEAEPILDYHGSLAAYYRDPDWQAAVVEHYEANLRAMIGLCRAAGVPMLLVLPPSNLADCPPFKSQPSDNLSAVDRARWAEQVAAAATCFQSDVAAAVTHLEAAIALDPLYAQTWYDLGKCLEALERWEEARVALTAARDLDICPLRMLSVMEERCRRVAAETGTPFLDAATLVAAACPHQLPGSPVLIDHVHPGPEGHQMLAWALLERMGAERMMADPHPQRAAIDAAFANHVDSLDELYFLRGRRTLKQVQGWTRGTADGPDAAARFPHRVQRAGGAPEPTADQ